MEVSDKAIEKSETIKINSRLKNEIPSNFT